jgi:hypothetical protein
MAIVRNVSGGKAAVAVTSSAIKPKTGLIKKVVLPTEYSEPVYDIEKTTIFFYGEEKVGKTSLAAQFPDPLFLMFEPGGKWLRIKRLPEDGQFEKFEEFILVVDEILKSSMFKNVIIDTADLAYELSEDYICEENGEDFINDGKLAFGKGGTKACQAFKKQILRLTSTGRGVIFVSHTKQQQFVRGTGVTYDKIIPTAADKVKRFLKGFVDITAFCGYFGDDRYIVIQGDQSLDAGHRVDGRFLTINGSPVSAVPMGENAKEAYGNFLAAFNNKQKETHDNLRKASISDVKKKFELGGKK